MKTFKHIFIYITALFAAFVIMLLIQQINLWLHPLPSWVNPDNPQHLAQYFPTLPLAALLMVELAYALGAFTAGSVLSICIKEKRGVAVLITGTILTLLGFINLAAIPHPLWLAILTTLTYLPMVWLGSKIKDLLKTNH